MNKFRMCAIGIVFTNDGRLMLCHNKQRNIWTLPEGDIESEETPWEAAIRSVRKVTGLHIQVARLVGLYFRTERDLVQFSFLCKKIGGGIKQTSKTDRIQYFDLNVIPPNVLPRHLGQILDLLFNQFGVTLKVQN